jgi:hypothetical protein
MTSGVKQPGSTLRRSGSANEPNSSLDAAEAYVDVVRYLRLIELGQQNVAIHERIQRS